MIVVDAEMTGTDVRYHGIISIGAVDMRNPDYQFYEECRVFSDEHVMNESLAVNGFSESDIISKDKQQEGELVTHFLDWIQETDDHTFAGHNPFFDLSFIKASGLRSHVNWTLADRTVDLHSICYTHMIWNNRQIPLENKRTAITSDYVFTYTGLPAEPHPHHALRGARYEAEAFSRLLYGDIMFEEFSVYSIPDYLHTR